MKIEELTIEFEEVQKGFPACINCKTRLSCSICQLYTEWLEQKLTQPCPECEWTDILLGIFMTSCGNSFADVAINETIKYCPYCGKYIKIKEGNKNDG